MRHDLKVFRVSHNLTQNEMADKLAVSVSTYNLVENGKRRGSEDFWLRLKNQFNLTGEQVWNLQHGTTEF